MNDCGECKKLTGGYCWRHLGLSEIILRFVKCRFPTNEEIYRYKITNTTIIYESKL